MNVHNNDTVERNKVNILTFLILRWFEWFLMFIGCFVKKGTQFRSTSTSLGGTNLKVECWKWTLKVVVMGIVSKTWEISKLRQFLSTITDSICINFWEVMQQIKCKSINHRWSYTYPKDTNSDRPLWMY